MGVFVATCWRDLWRNRRRTILTGLVMVASVAIMVFSVAFGDGTHEAMIRNATSTFLGQVQIQEKGYADSPDLEHLIPASDVDRVSKILPGVEGVRSFAPRIQTGGLLSKKVPAPENPDDLEAYGAMTSEGAFVMGVVPAMERRVSTLADSLVADDPAARCLRGCRSVLASAYRKDDSRCEATCADVGDTFQGEACRARGARACEGICRPGDPLCDEAECIQHFSNYCEPPRFLALENPYDGEAHRDEVVLGAGLAQVLDVDVGDEVAFTTGTARGRSFASLYRVVGVVKTGSTDINRTFALTHYKKLSRALEVPGAASGIIIAADDLTEADRVAESVGEAIGSSGGLVARSWKQLSPELNVFVQIDQGSLLVMLVMLVMIVGVILANVVTMAVMERTREFGVRLAIGESPGRIALGLLTEILLLALTAGALGGVIGELLSLYFQSHGIDYGGGMVETTGVVMNTVFYTRIRLYGLVFSIGTVVGFSLLGALWPAWRIRKIRPVDALRFV